MYQEFKDEKPTTTLHHPIEIQSMQTFSIDGKRKISAGDIVSEEIMRLKL